MSLFADDLLFCGPAPKEFWDKQTTYSMFERPFADTSFVITYSIIDREIKIAKDGNSAISTESYFLGKASTKIPLDVIVIYLVEGPILGGSAGVFPHTYFWFTPFI